MVGAFHGHAHNRMCQLDWHPQYIQGTGHTKGEGCEHVFATSNELARSTRHATSFHHHQAIEQHFAFWDANKHAALSKYLWVHFDEAVQAISTLTFELDVIKKEYNLIDDDFVQFHVDECAYLENLKQLVIHDQLLIHYVQILDELEAYCAEWDAAQEAANNALTEVPVGNLEELSIAIRRSCVCVDTSYAKLQHVETHTSNVEMHLGIQLQWEIGGEEYKHYKAEATMVKYWAALDELEWLVVMRLFELSKIAMSGTGKSLMNSFGQSLNPKQDINCANRSAKLCKGVQKQFATQSVATIRRRRP
ncbi:hypothetical protein BKA83DRAFT_4055633 [Pisolithus microcarpus]|nr:hypothetical protein BKA83DRAFT_4055633 [Pisolithus microcarpus]